MSLGNPESLKGMSEQAQAYDQAKAEANLEYGRRVTRDHEREENGEDRIYGELGQERVIKKELTGLFKDSSIADKIKRREGAGLSPVALFTDIDNTFYRKGQVEATHKLECVLLDNDWGLTYVTGRDFQMVDEQTDLPKADVVVGAVGTEIYVRSKDGKYAMDEEYRKLLLGTWDRGEVYKISQEIVAFNPSIVFQERDVPEANESGKTNHPPQEFKISFNVFGDNKAAQSMVDIMNNKIRGARVILSQDIHDPQRWNIDLLPVHAGKELAVRYLSEKLGVRGVVSGDSGNDLTMLTDSRYPAILVGGSHEHVKGEIMQFIPAPGPSMQTRELVTGHKIIIGEDGIDTAAKGLLNNLQKGDFNPEDAKWFVRSLYELSRQEDK